MAVVLKNNASSRLAVALAAGATSFSVTAGEGAEYPSVASGSGDWFPLTLIKATGALEIVRCTARSGDVFTVVRAQEGTSAQAFSVGDRVELRTTVSVFSEFQQLLSEMLRKDDNLASLTSAGTARGNLGLGTAAVATVQTSVSDTTIGRLLIFGAMGLGNAIQTTDLNTAPGGFFWAIPNTVTGSPDATAGVLYGYTFTSSAGSTRAQFALHSGTGLMYRRNYNGSTWGSWTSAVDSSSISTFMRTVLGSADAASARTTLGTPAGVDKQMCTAWVSFIGTGTVAISDSHNVSSITDNGIGDYTVNFASVMSNASFSAGVTCTFQRSSGGWADVLGVVSQSVSNVRVTTQSSNTGSFDNPRVNVQVFGGK